MFPNCSLYGLSYLLLQYQAECLDPIRPREVEEEVLWRGIKMGKHGQPSTNVEYFNAAVRDIRVDEQD